MNDTILEISLNNISKRFQYHWILKEVNLEVQSGDRLGILGANGSGKSTLLKIMSSIVPPTKGEIKYSLKLKNIPPQKIYRHFSLASPYLELIEELNLPTFLSFHKKAKGFISGLSVDDVISIIGLGNQSGKELKFYSSGMKQRVKLAIAVLSDVEIIFLDEPSTNLDQVAIAWYHNMLEKYVLGRTIVVASNDYGDFKECNRLYLIKDGSVTETML